MTAEKLAQAPSARVIVVGNEKGGTGKSTVAMHVAIALMKAGQRVGTIDLDSRQKTFTNYIENRHAWAQHIGRDLEIPRHIYFVENTNNPTAEDDIADGKSLLNLAEHLRSSCNYIVIDTPGRSSYVGRLAHSIADILITPLNDSFVDLDVLGAVDRQTLTVTGANHYAQMVEAARQQRQLRDNVSMDWVVLRNRLSMLGSRNSRCVGQSLEQLSQTLGCRCIEGLAERVIFREYYLRGLTALDTLDEATLGTRPTMSHVTARYEIESLLSALGLSTLARQGEINGSSRDAA